MLHHAFFTMKVMPRAIKIPNDERRSPGTTSLNEIQKLPPSSKWSDDELFAARLVVRSATARPDINHLLPDLRDHFAEAATAYDQTRIRELLKPADVSHGILTDTQLVHLYGASLGSFWAALAQFGNPEGREVEAKNDGVDKAEDDDDVDMYMVAGEGGGRRRPYSPGSNPSPSRKRFRKQTDFPDYNDSSKMRVGSSPYSESSSQQAFSGFRLCQPRPTFSRRPRTRHCPDCLRLHPPRTPGMPAPARNPAP